MRSQNQLLNELTQRAKAESGSDTDNLPIIERDYRIEVIRKAIHLFSLSIPIIYFFLHKPIALAIIIPVTIAFLTVDISRYYHKPIEEWFNKHFGFLLRKRENDKAKKTLNGATYVLISATVCIILFPKIIAVTSFAILIISDLTAALVGRRFGKHRFLAKSLEGSVAFFLSALIVIAVAPKITYQLGEYMIGIAAAFVGTIVEALPAEIDDNLSIPICVGAALWLLYALFYPAVNVFQFG